jgi:hypothetical protein
LTEFKRRRKEKKSKEVVYRKFLMPELRNKKGLKYFFWKNVILKLYFGAEKNMILE